MLMLMFCSFRSAYLLTIRHTFCTYSFGRVVFGPVHSKSNSRKTPTTPTPTDPPTPLPSPLALTHTIHTHDTPRRATLT